MSGPVILLSSELINRENLLDFTTRHGGFINESPSLDNRVSEDTNHVWYGVSKGDLDCIDDATKEKFFKMFGKMPQTCLILEISSSEHSMSLAMRLAAALSKEWPIVVDSKHELLQPDATLTL